MKLIFVFTLLFCSQSFAGLLTGYQGYMKPAESTTIANGATTSAAINTGGMALVGIKIPAAFTGTAITFTVCDTIDGTYVPLKVTTSGTALSYTVAASGYYAIDPVNFQGVQFFKIVSGSAESGARTIVYSLKGF